MNSRSRPERLFRYFPPAASDFFSAKKLWMSAVQDYNDPFDAFPRFDKMLESQSQRGIEREFAFLPPHASWDWTNFKKNMSRDAAAFNAEFAEAVSDEYVTLVSERVRSACFSAGSINKLLMWSHYAASHTGFVVEFDPKHQLFATDEFEKVLYECERPDVEGTKSEDLWKMLFRKSDEWITEAEWRLVKSANSLATGKRRDGKTMRYLELPPDSIRAVFFGCQILAGACVELLESVRRDEWKDVKKFVMSRDPAKYAIEPISWEQWCEKPDTFRTEFHQLVREYAHRTP